MKKFIYALIPIFLFGTLLSQEEIIPLEVRLKNAGNCPVIFEAIIEDVQVFAGDKLGNKIPDSEAKWNGSRGMLYDKDGNEATGYSKVKLKVISAYKGNVSQEYVDVIFKSLVIQDLHLAKVGNETKLSYIFIPPSHGADFIIMPSAKGQRYILFCNTLKDLNQYVFNPKTGIESNINVTEYMTVSTQSEGNYANGFGKTFKNKEELNDFLKGISGVTVGKTSEPEKKSPINVESQKTNQEIEDVLKRNAENYNTWLSLRPKKLSNNANKTSLANDITMSITSSRLVDSASAKWLEFDVAISSNNGSLYFDSFLAHIQYNTAAFGSSVIANSNIVAIMDPAFTSPTYTNPSTYWSDAASNIFVLPFGSSASGPYNRILCPTVPTRAVTIRLKIQNCSVLSGIQFTNTGFTGGFCFYTPAANTPLTGSLGFDNGFYNGNINDLTCVPIINSFNNNIPAGVGRHFVVNGKYFGKTKGSGTVIFKNSDKGTVYPATGGPYDGGVQQYDVVSWSDSQIKINLPAYIDSVSGTGYSVPGTGKFLVKNFTNTKTESSTILTIPYAVYQYPNLFPYYKFNIQLSGKLPKYNYEVQCNPNVTTSFPTAKPVINKAMHDWSCVTGINWQMKNDTNLASLNDGVCVVNVSNSFSALQRTFRQVLACPSGTGAVYYEKSFDIEIKQSPSFGTWQIDTIGTLLANNYDFYAAIQHELGHGHLVEHINDSIGDIMWWAAYAWPYNITARKHLWYSSGAQDGGNYIADSLTTILTCAGNHVITLPQNCQGFIGIKKNAKNSLSITVFPNPVNSNQSLYLKFENQNIKGFSYQLIDITGKVVEDETIVNNGSPDYEISMSRFQSGIYLLRLRTDGGTQAMKIIKQ